MERLIDTAGGPHRSLDPTRRQDRRLALGGLTAVVLLAWLYLWHSAAQMAPGTMPMAAMPRATDAGALALTFVMWTVMMAGMMLPSAAPAIVLYGALARKHGARGRLLPGVWLFTAAYLVVWTLFSAMATLLQAALDAGALLGPDMATTSTTLAGATLIAAGLYQLTPLKAACLGRCRDPLTFFLTRWRDGPLGAFRMGLAHGGYCLGCCWALMLLLFVAGVMNLVWVALIAAFVFVEKLLPGARAVTLAASVALVAAGLFLLTGGPL